MPLVFAMSILERSTEFCDELDVRNVSGIALCGLRIQSELLFYANRSVPRRRGSVANKAWLSIRFNYLTWKI
jgi:hypothetical protein